MSMPSSASGTVATGSELEKTIQIVCRWLEGSFKAEHGDDSIKKGLGFAWFAVRQVILKAGDSNQKECLKNESEFNAYVTSGSDGERELIKLLRRMAKQEVPWRDLFDNEAFYNPVSEKETDQTRSLATTLAWNSEFKGDLASVLFGTIADYLSKERSPYARLTMIVNSSGTGKSRMVDQLGTEIIAVPMCLRRKRGGFPPFDKNLRNWLTSLSGERRSVRNMLHAFTYSLLMVTYQRLETIAEEQDINKLSFDKADAENLTQEERNEYVSMVAHRQKKLASAFRENMTKGQTYDATNNYRNSFYKEVINAAERFVERRQQDHPYASEGKGLHEAGEDLCRFIDEHRLSDSKNGPRRPLVILAFDEADTLIDNPPDEKNWNLFSELRHVLREIQHLQIFSLFLSTAARFDKFFPDVHSNPLARAREPEFRRLDPISEISFDDIAYPALKDTVTIDKVVEIDWICHLGRPLFGSYWDKLGWELKGGPEIMDFAKQKLLCGSNELEAQNRAGSLACLSTRFALEFNMDGTARDVTYTLVERHMRLCIAATAGLEKMITIAGSEPLLAEAAYELMNGTGTNAVCHLAMHSDLNCIDRGRRGELVATLLIMQAYDAAREDSSGRQVSVVNFMKALLPPEKYNILLQSAPTSWPVDHPGGRTFEAIFKDYCMWFNHVIKIEEKSMISIDHLWKFVVRGAMIVCATNIEGIDIVLPVCHTTQNLGPDSVTAIIIQVKNAKDYKETIQGNLFDAMDHVVKSVVLSKLPEPGVDLDPDHESTRAQPKKKRKTNKVGPKTVEPKLEPKPVIRIVFALASPEPAVVFKDRPERLYHFDGFTAFDIWLAGLSDKTYRQIEDGDLVHYRTLLERSLAPHDAFELTGVGHIDEEAKKSRGARRREMVPLTFPEHAHHSIHRVKDIERAGGPGGQPGVAIRPAKSSTRATTTAGPSTIKNPKKPHR